MTECVWVSLADSRDGVDLDEFKRWLEQEIIDTYPDADILEMLRVTVDEYVTRFEVIFDPAPEKVISMRWNCDHCEASGDTWEGMREHYDTCAGE